MSNLAKRLRDTGEGDIYLAPTSTKLMIDEAADHIDALNAALEAYATETMERIDELEAALSRLVSWGAACPTEREERLSHAAEGAKAFHAARAALGEDVHD